jgi:hypothetical protein
VNARIDLDLVRSSSPGGLPRSGVEPHRGTVPRAATPARRVDPGDLVWSARFRRDAAEKAAGSTAAPGQIDADIDALDGLNARDYETRTEINLDTRKLRGQASGILYPADLPPQAIDVQALPERLRHRVRTVDREGKAWGSGRFAPLMPSSRNSSVITHPRRNLSSPARPFKIALQ